MNSSFAFNMYNFKWKIKYLQAEYHCVKNEIFSNKLVCFIECKQGS